MKLIAELCQNHNGSMDTMLRMVERASSSGATHVKLQHIFSDNLSFRTEFETGYVDNNVIKCIKRPYQAEYDRLKALELSDNVVHIVGGKSAFVAFKRDRSIVSWGYGNR